MNFIKVTPGAEGFGTGLTFPIASGLKVVSLTGREIHPVARRLGELAQSEVINGFKAVPPDEETLCVVINCGGSLRCGLYPKKGIKTINVMPTGQAGPMAQFARQTASAWTRRAGMRPSP